MLRYEHQAAMMMQFDLKSSAFVRHRSWTLSAVSMAFSCMFCLMGVWLVVRSTLAAQASLTACQRACRQNEIQLLFVLVIWCWR